MKCWRRYSSQSCESLRDHQRRKYYVEESKWKIWPLKFIILLQGCYDWLHLKLQIFKWIIEYNYAPFKFTSQLKVCSKDITKDQILEKTFSAFTPQILSCNNNIKCIISKCIWNEFHDFLLLNEISFWWIIINLIPWILNNPLKWMKPLFKRQRRINDISMKEINGKGEENPFKSNSSYQ